MPALCSESSHAPLVQHVLLAGFLSLRVPAAECCPCGLSTKPAPRSATYWRYHSPFRAPFSTPPESRSKNSAFSPILRALVMSPCPLSLAHLCCILHFSQACALATACVLLTGDLFRLSFLPKFPLTLWSLLKNVSRQQLFPDLACACSPSGWSALLKT